MSDKSANIALVEPFFTSSHEQWAQGLMKHSKHSFNLFSLPGRNWKWRMHGAAVELARRVNEQQSCFDIFLVSDMLDLTTFKALLNIKYQRAKFIIYFHENQLTYPWSPDDQDVDLKRDRHYAFINYTSALCADKVLFNSDYHKNSFLDALNPFLTQFPDYQNVQSVNEIAQKSKVLPIGFDFTILKKSALYNKNDIPVVLWNHRWEFDKNPELFFETLYRLKEEGIAFRLMVLGESYRHSPGIFKELSQKLEQELIHIGWLASKEAYYEALWNADILPVTSYQDFFGISVMEALFCCCVAIMPKRLTYEELYQNLSGVLFYETEAAFYEQMKDVLLNFNKHTFSTEIRHNQLNDYDWSILVQNYDHFFSQITT